jgi:hypothetical protein
MDGDEEVEAGASSRCPPRTRHLLRGRHATMENDGEPIDVKVFGEGSDSGDF